MRRLEAIELLRTALTLLAASMVVAVSAGEALAKHRRHVARHHCACHRAMVAQTPAPPGPALGQMRYYGGPKSPMWREVR
jgi:hypothetical protein